MISNDIVLVNISFIKLQVLKLSMNGKIPFKKTCKKESIWGTFWVSTVGNSQCGGMCMHAISNDTIKYRPWDQVACKNSNKTWVTMMKGSHSIEEVGYESCSSSHCFFTLQKIGITMACKVGNAMRIGN